MPPEHEVAGSNPAGRILEERCGVDFPCRLPTPPWFEPATEGRWLAQVRAARPEPLIERPSRFPATHASGASVILPGALHGDVAPLSLSAGWGFVLLHALQRVCQFAVSVRPVSDWPVPLSRRCQTTVRGGGLAVRPVRLPRAWLLYACTDEGQCNNLYTNLDGYADTEMVTQGGCWGDTNSSGPMLWRFTLIWNLDGGGGGSDDDDGSGGPA